MRKWENMIDFFRLPLMILLLAAFLKLVALFLVSNMIIENISSNFVNFSFFLEQLANFIIINFPLIVLIKYLSYKYDNNAPILIGIISYLVFNVTTMIYCIKSLPDGSYYSILGLSLINDGQIYFPVQFGIIGMLICAFCTIVCFNNSDLKRTFGLFSFVDINMRSLIKTCILTFFIALIICFFWPSFINRISSLAYFISQEKSNPFHLFLFGLIDKLLSVLGIQTFFRNFFWFNELGGSWLDPLGNMVLGDVSMWSAHLENGIFVEGVGRFITPYYIINIFCIPAYLFALYSMYTFKIERKRFTTLLIFLIVTLALTGISLPIELFMLISSPLLFLFHLLATSTLFGVLILLKISLGFVFDKSHFLAFPGNLFDLISYGSNDNYKHIVTTLVILGVIFALIYFIVTRIYYEKGLGKKINLNYEELLDNLGGIDNIDYIYGSFNKVGFHLKNSKLAVLSYLKDIQPNFIRETKKGYTIGFGQSSRIIYLNLKKLINKKEIKK